MHPFTWSIILVFLCKAMLSIFDGGRGGAGLNQPAAGPSGVAGGGGGVTFQDENASLDEGLKMLDSALADIASTLAVPEVH